MCDCHFHLSDQELWFLHPFTTFVIILTFTNHLLSYLGANQLSGAIPDSIGNLTNLQRLYVALSFPSFLLPILILTSIHLLSFTHIMFSYLNFNQLSGAIPDSIGNLREPCQSSRPVYVTIIPFLSLWQLKQNAKMATSTPQSTTEGSNFSWGFLFNTEAFLRTWEFIR